MKTALGIEAESDYSLPHTGEQTFRTGSAQRIQASEYSRLTAASLKHCLKEWYRLFCKV